MAAALMGWLQRMCSPRPPAPWRCGVLNTGELALIDPVGNVQVLSRTATLTVEEVLLGRVAVRDGDMTIDEVMQQREGTGMPPLPPIEDPNNPGVPAAR